MTTLNQAVTAHFMGDAAAQVAALAASFAAGNREVVIAGETLQFVADGDAASLYHPSSGDDWLVCPTRGQWVVGHRWRGKPSYNTTPL